MVGTPDADATPSSSPEAEHPEGSGRGNDNSPRTSDMSVSPLNSDSSYDSLDSSSGSDSESGGEPSTLNEPRQSTSSPASHGKPLPRDREEPAVDESKAYDEDAGDITSAVQLKAKTMNWPPGPYTISELMQWASYNAETLLNQSPHAEICRRNLQHMLQHPIELHEAYAGSGTGSWTMHHQHKHMVSVIRRELDEPDLVSAGVTSVTACDVDNHCRKVLASLQEEYRPRHVMGALEDRISKSALADCIALRTRMLEQVEQEIRAAKCDDATASHEASGRAIRTAAGEVLFDQYVKRLSQNSDGSPVFLPKAKCHSCAGGRKTQDYPTPVACAAGTQTAGPARKLRMALAGSSCVDVSAIGNGSGLLGVSGLPLAIWVSEKRISREDIICHECGPRFSRKLLEKYLGDLYEIHWVKDPAHGQDWLLSQHKFGWPEHRPRSYTIMLLKGSVTFDEEAGGIQLIHDLMRAPAMPVSKLFCAPKESVEAARRETAHRLCRPLRSEFRSLLTGAKPSWLSQYASLKKVRQHQLKAKQRGYPLSMIANLQQNPTKRPIIASWLPALLRQGCMFIIHLNGGEDLGEERWLLDEEHLHRMGIPMFPNHSDPTCKCPIFDYVPPATVKKRLAGNAMHAAVIGTVHAVLLCALKVQP